MIRLHVRNLSKSFRRSEWPVVRGVDFQLDEGRLLTLVGESGSGKTTVLRLLAGLESPDDGEISLDGRVISSPERVAPPESRGIGLVFQQHALFPHLTVENNIAFGLASASREERRQTIGQMLELTGLASYRERYPHELSGGERQRVALARALAPSPRLLLLDEPFSSLDARLRQSVRDETRAILKQRNATAIFVTHDTTDALSIADHIVVLREGVVQQAGAPAEVYRSPANAYVASFFGPCNFLPLASLPPPGSPAALSACQAGPPPGAKDSAPALWIRPEDLRLAPPESAPADALTGTVIQIHYHGSHLEVTLACERGGASPFEVIAWRRETSGLHLGERWAVLPRG